MALFSGDGTGLSARLLKNHGAVIIGGLHLKMPDSIGDVKALKRGFERNKELVMKAEEKIHTAVSAIKSGNPPQEGLGLLYHLAGLFGQRLYFGGKPKKYTDKLKIDPQKCIGCGLCEKLCPMDNITLTDGIASSGDRCTMCYRCISKCPILKGFFILGKVAPEILYRKPLSSSHQIQHAHHNSVADMVRNESVQLSRKAVSTVCNDRYRFVSLFSHHQNLSS